MAACRYGIPPSPVQAPLLLTPPLLVTPSSPPPKTGARETLPRISSPAQMLARSLGSRNPDALVMGSEVISQFLVNPKVKDLLDVANIAAGRLRLDAQSNGVLSRDPGVLLRHFFGFGCLRVLDSSRMDSKSALVASYTWAAGRVKCAIAGKTSHHPRAAQSTLGQHVRRARYLPRGVL